MIDLQPLVEEVGGVEADPVTVSGLGTREGGVPGVRCVTAPQGIDWFQPDEMTVSCGAATAVEELQAALGAHGQYVNLPPGGTVGGALGVGRSDVLRLGRGPVRDVLLQARYVNAAGELVTAGGPTVKNVTGFDVCRLLVGSRGTLGVIGDVILRTRPLPPAVRWFRAAPGSSPVRLASGLHRPAAVLWDGESTWVCLQGHPGDIDAEASAHRLGPVDGPPPLPTTSRLSLRPGDLAGLAPADGFVAEIGVGIVHSSRPAPPRHSDPGIEAIHRRLKHEFDPTARLSPSRRVIGGG